MDHQSLVPIAQRAILQALNYHLLSAENGSGLPALDQETRNIISSDIQKNLPLVAYAVDKHKAHLEIVCDAALPVAEKYNINKRWFYVAVQGMTSMELVPNLYEGVEAPTRLSTLHTQVDDGIASFEDQEMDHGGDEEEEGAGAQPHAQATNATARPKNSGLHWSDNEIRRLIDLHVAGEGAPIIAEQLGRSRNAVQFAWRKVRELDSTWKDYLEKKMNAMEAEQNNGVEQASESDGSDESKGDKGADGKGADETTNATTVADASAVPDPKRPWTDADMRKLVELKLSGLTAHAIGIQMRRPHGSVHCTWMNAAGNPGNKWFYYIHKQFRAQKKEKQKKASEGSAEGN